MIDERINSRAEGQVRRYRAPGISHRINNGTVISSSSPDSPPQPPSLTSYRGGNKPPNPQSLPSRAGKGRGNESVTKGQIAAIWTIIRKNGLDEEAFREFLQKEFKVTSTKDLSHKDAYEVIRCLKVVIGEEYEPHLRYLTWGITKPQMRYARILAKKLGWDDPKRLDGLVRKMFPPKNRIELCNKTEGTSLIIALEKMDEEKNNRDSSDGRISVIKQEKGDDTNNDIARSD